MKFSMHTRRLWLRDFEAGDEQLVNALLLDPRQKHFNLRAQSTQTYIQEHINEALAQRSRQPRWMYDLIIEQMGTRCKIGSCSLKYNSPEIACGHLSWHILPVHWNRGYATEAAARLLEFGFEELRLSAIKATAFADNTASIRVMEKIGLRPAINNRVTTWWRGLCLGESRPVVCYALSQQEWLAHRPQIASQPIASPWSRAA